MATMLVCDIDQKLDAKTVTIDVDGKRYSKDLCDAHIKEILAGAHEVARRGRPKDSARDATPGNKGQSRKAKA